MVQILNIQIYEQIIFMSIKVQFWPWKPKNLNSKPINSWTQFITMKIYLMLTCFFPELSAASHSLPQWMEFAQSNNKEVNKT